MNPTPALAVRRRGRVGVVIGAVIGAGLAATPPAASSDTAPVDVHTEASYAVTLYSPNHGDRPQSWQDAIRGTAGSAAAGSGRREGTSAHDAWAGEAGAYVDLADGRLGAISSVSTSTSDSSGYIDMSSSATAAVVDTITLDAPANVIFRGRLTGSTMAVNNDDEYADYPRGGPDFSMSFASTEEECSPDGCWPVEYAGGRTGDSGYTLGPTGELVGTIPVDEPLEVVAELPAGTTIVTVSLVTDVGSTQDGYVGRSLSSVARLDYGSTGAFDILVPDDVGVASGSGLLPITGGRPLEDDTTEPTVSASVAPAPNDRGWHTGDGDVVVTFAATDDTGVESITFSASGAEAVQETTVPGSQAELPVSAEGVTTVTYSARDAAGNVGSGDPVTVKVDRTPPVLRVPGLVSATTTDPAGIPVSYAAAATDTVDPAPDVACTPPSGSRFPVGATTVTCTAADAAGLMTNGSFPVTVTLSVPPQDEIQMLQDMRAEVASLPAPRLVREALDAQLRFAQRLVSQGRDKAAMVQLRLFEAQVALLEQRRVIPRAAAEALIAASREVRAALAG